MEDENDTNHSDRKNDQKPHGGNQLAELKLVAEKIQINGLSELAEENLLDNNYQKRKYLLSI
jgi:hypothetical protein